VDGSDTLASLSAGSMRVPRAREPGAIDPRRAPSSLPPSQRSTPSDFQKPNLSEPASRNGWQSVKPADWLAVVALALTRKVNTRRRRSRPPGSYSITTMYTRA